MIALIVAFAKNRVIGNKGCIPWKIKGNRNVLENEQQEISLLWGDVLMRK